MAAKAPKIASAPTTPTNKSVSLYFTEGSSDKVYAAQLEAKGDGYVVNFQYGRRGSSLKAETKTPAPLEWEKAEKLFNKIVSEKKAKGYTEAESGERFQDTSNAGRVTGVVPQLLNAIDENEVGDYVRNNAWGAQEKFNGERRLVLIENDRIIGTNRDGLSIAMSASLETAFMEVVQSGTIDPTKGRTVIDGEDLGDKGFAPFDLLEWDGVCYRKRPYVERFQALQAVLAKAGLFIVPPTLAVTTAEKAALLQRLRDETKEGLVFKKLDAAWNAGRPASGGHALKFKFLASATVIARPGRTGKRSVSIWVLDAAGQEVAVGNVTVPALLPDGTLIEVEYLYAYKGGSLFQPTFQGVRRDKQTADRLETLKFKPD